MYIYVAAATMLGECHGCGLAVAIGHGCGLAIARGGECHGCGLAVALATAATWPSHQAANATAAAWPSQEPANAAAAAWRFAIGHGCGLVLRPEGKQCKPRAAAWCLACEREPTAAAWCFARNAYR